MVRWLSKQNEPPPEGSGSFNTQKISFLAEQDGDVERNFKTRLVERFKSNIHVAVAYLVRVRYETSPEPHVALCLTADDIGRAEIVREAGLEFRKIFKTTECLDILFLTSAQQHEIRSVAKPFYQQGLNRF